MLPSNSLRTSAGRFAEASRRAAKGDDEGVQQTLSEALLLSFAFCAPAAAGLAVLGVPLARLLYLWGAMGASEVANIGETIRYYSFAVVFYSSVKVVAPVFYAQGRLRVPLIASLVAVAANLACALALHPILQWRALALAVGVGQMANLAVLMWAARRVYGGAGRGMAAPALKILLATAICTGAAWGVSFLMPAGSGVGARLAAALVPVGVGVCVYLGAGWLLRCREILVVLDKAARRS